MEQVTIIGVDLAKNVFQLHGAYGDGAVAFRKKLTRPQFQRFMREVDPCLVAMEACSGAHYWARELTAAGHEVRLIAPRYVKPFLKRQKNDTADAEAIAEAALRPTMRFVEPKSADQQAQAIVFRTREQFVNQRTELVNALRSHLYEFGYYAPQGIQYLSRLAEVVEDEGTDLPDPARYACRLLLEQISALTEQIKSLQDEISEISMKTGISRQLQTMPGVGPIGAMAIEAFAPPMGEIFPL